MTNISGFLFLFTTSSQTHERYFGIFPSDYFWKSSTVGNFRKFMQSSNLESNVILTLREGSETRIRSIFLLTMVLLTMVFYNYRVVELKKLMTINDLMNNSSEVNEFCVRYKLTCT